MIRGENWMDRLVLVGMSGRGKTYQSKGLVPSGYIAYHIDDLIEADLRPILDAAGFAGLGSTDATAAWMGMPGSERYEERQRQYLALENALTARVVMEIMSLDRKDVVIDTTGSVVHLDREVRKALKNLGTVVYLDATEDEQDQMLAQYRAEPKPVCFGDHWHPRHGETYEESLARCYRNLLVWRSGEYAQLADVTIRGSELHKEGVVGGQFLARIAREVGAIHA